MLNSPYNLLIAAYRAVAGRVRRKQRRLGEFAWKHGHVAKCGLFAVAVCGLAILIGWELSGVTEVQTAPVTHVFLDESISNQNVAKHLRQTAMRPDSRSNLSQSDSAATLQGG